MGNQMLNLLNSIRKQRWFIPVLAGLGIGALNLIHYFFSPTMIGSHFGMAPGGFLAATSAWFERTILGKNIIFQGIPPVFRVLILGIVAGSTVSALTSKELTLASFRKVKVSTRKVLQALAGGIIMGFGVLLGNGCLIKHALSGTPGLLLSSFLSFFGIIAGLWVGTKALEKWL